jgi:hypothetical protein
MVSLERLSLAVMCALGAGCARPDYYTWGSYNASVYELMNEQDSFELDTSIRTLETEIANSPQDKIPPGKAAYVGLLLLRQGDSAEARDYFMLERKLFPESSRLMSRLIEKIEMR